MDSPEGKGIARAAWEAYANAVTKVSAPAIRPLARGIARKQVIELVGFWVAWHLYGGFEGLVEHVGMHPTTVWRKVKKFRVGFGEHPDVYKMPGVTIEPEVYWAAVEGGAKALASRKADKG